jgi:hypothetical protein
VGIHEFHQTVKSVREDGRIIIQQKDISPRRDPHALVGRAPKAKISIIDDQLDVWKLALELLTGTVERVIVNDNNLE